MAEESVLSFEGIIILIKWKSGELIELNECRGHLVQEEWDDEGQRRSHDGWEELHHNVRPEESHGHVRANRPQSRAAKSCQSTHGIDGLEKSLECAIVKRLREKVVNLNDLAQVLKNYELQMLEPEWRSDISQIFVPLIRQTITNVSSELLQMQKRNPTMSLEDFKVYFHPVCWSSRKRLDFFCSLSNTLSEEPKNVQLSKQLKSKWLLHFKGNWINKIDLNFINQINLKHRPHDSSVVGLLRFVRNRWHHPEEFRRFRGTDSPEDFYNYFGGLFPDLLRVSYGEALRCKEPRLDKFRPIETF